MRPRYPVCLIGALVAASLSAQPAFEVPQLECLPREGNAPITVKVDWSGSDGGKSPVRLYFRRLHPFGDFYYVEMVPRPDQPGSYYSVFPIPEERQQSQLDDSELADEWWDVLRNRAWLKARGWDREGLRDWLAAQDHEAAEYFVAAHNLCTEDPPPLDKRDLKLVPVRDDCKVELSPWEAGLAESLTVGELTAYQANRQVFHWECWGVVSRISSNDGEPACAYRADDFCRACVVAGFPIAPLAGGLVAVVSAHERSPSRP